MALVHGIRLLEKARKRGYAVPAFNIQNMETVQAVFSACRKEDAPAFVQVTESSIEYAGLERLFKIADFEAENSGLPACIHLDHGHRLDYIKWALETGFTSVMIDASKKEFSENMLLTKKVVSMAKKTGASVEAELGALGKIGETPLTDPEQAKEFAKKSKCHSLAVAIGTSHGAYKFTGTPKLDLERLGAISKLVKIPLVLHGASRVVPWAYEQASKYGAEISGAQGLPDSQLVKAVKLGIAKVNIDTDLRLSFTAGVRKVLATDRKNFDPRKYLSAGRAMVERTARQKIRVLGASGKA